MQKNVAICIIILATLGAIVVSWMAFHYWRARFKRELLVSYHIGKQHMPVREVATVQAPSTSTPSSSGPVEQFERPVKKKKAKATSESSAEPSPTKQTRNDAQRQREMTTTAAAFAAAPAPPPHNSPPTSTTTNTNVCDEKGKQHDTNEWAQPAESSRTATAEQNSPNPPVQTTWSRTSNAGTSSEWGQPATQSEQSQSEWSGAGQDAMAGDKW